MDWQIFSRHAEIDTIEIYMRNDKFSYKKFDHNEHAKSCAQDDFWGQIRRTVNGEPVSEKQIKMIIHAIMSKLQLSPDDKLLDLACGNGALSNLLFDSIAEYQGVDYSEYLISVAKIYFERLPLFRFVTLNVIDYLDLESNPEIFTKVLCYGSFSYFPASDANKLLRNLHDKFTNVQSVFIGNLPDKDRSAAFYNGNLVTADELVDHESQIGIWRNQDEFKKLACESGWNAQFSVMPTTYYASHYRYDVLLTR
jgi:cyclopropane fatty-acyl-phospholipid synthase-like methyltransferase